jgi:ABC-2 type transport system permease protein
MKSRHVARKEFTDAIRSRAIWFAVGVFTAMLLLGIMIPLLAIDDADARLLTTYLQGPATHLILPILAVMLGYRTIVGERERGSIAFLLALPFTRRDILIGKVLGRAAVLAVAILAGFLVASAVIVIVAGRPPVGHLLAFTLVTILCGTAYVAISVGVSAVSTTGTRAISILVGGYVFGTSLWVRIPDAVYYLIHGTFPGSDPPWWVHLAIQLNPVDAYGTLGVIVLPETTALHVSADESGMTATESAATVVPDTAIHDPTFLVPVLLAWIVLPPVIGYLRFRDADLV